MSVISLDSIGRGGRGGGFKSFLWNPATGEFLGRTASSWIKITIFYIIFYACLAGVFSIFLWIFMQTIDPVKEPKWTGNTGGLIGKSPGVGFRPMPDRNKNPEVSIIWYRRGSPESVSYWVDQIKSYTDDAASRDVDKYQGEVCKDGARADKNKWCEMQFPSGIGECSERNKYGYPNGDPCILIKLNKIYAWTPEPYVAGDDLSGVNMPESLKLKIGNSTDQRVWFSCEGAGPADRENLRSITYYPDQGIPVVHYPYMNQGGYKSPYIFVKLWNVQPGVLVYVECKAWDKQIEHSKEDQIGMVRFAVMID